MATPAEKRMAELQSDAHKWQHDYECLVEDFERALLALRNVRALAVRMRRRDDAAAETAKHLLRYCADAGVKARILRTDDTGGQDGDPESG